MRHIYVVVKVAVFAVLYSQTASATTYEAIYKGMELVGSTTADVEADFFYAPALGTITNTTAHFPINQGGTEINSAFAGQPFEESARLYISTLGTFYFGSETSFTADYIEYPDIGESGVFHDISGIDGTLSGSFLVDGSTTVPADVTSGIPLLTSDGGGGDYAVANGPSGSFLVQSVQVIAPSEVPLPASAPLFGAAVLTLGALGYGVKRPKT